jgi:hypothetical protein
MAGSHTLVIAQEIFMKKIIAVIGFSLIAGSASADGYGGVGVGLSEACITKYQPSFAGGDCIDPNIDVRGLIGNQFSDYFAIEGSVDFSFDAGNIVDMVLGADDEDVFFYDPYVETNRWAILTLAVHPLVFLPITDSLRVFAGPSLGGSIVNFDYDVKYFGNSNSQSNSSTEFGWNYGWTTGVDLFVAHNSGLRLQWQNWRSLDADVPTNNEFNSNTLTLNLVSYF